MEREKMAGVRAIKTFFEKDGGKTVSMNEMKTLTSEDRAELAPLCAEALGVDLIPNP